MHGMASHMLREKGDNWPFDAPNFDLCGPFFHCFIYYLFRFMGYKGITWSMQFGWLENMDISFCV